MKSEIPDLVTPVAPIQSKRAKYQARTLTDTGGGVTCITFWVSPDKGNVLVSGCRDSTIKTWSLDKSCLINTLKGHADSIQCLAVTKHDPENAMLISGGDDGNLMLWSLSTGRLRHTLPGHHGGILSLALSTNARHQVFASAGQDKIIRIWNISSGEFMFQLQGHDGPVTSLVVSPGSMPYIISGGADRLVKVWELNTGRLIRKLDSYGGTITCLAISGDCLESPIVVSGDSLGAVVVWDLKKYKRLFNLIEPAETPVGINESSSALNDKGYFLDSSQSQKVNEIASITLSASENMVIITATIGMHVKIWDAKSGGLLRILEGGIYNTISCVLICHDALGALVAMSSEEGNIVLLSPEDDIVIACRSITSLREMSIETSLTIVGKYIAFARLAEDNVENNMQAYERFVNSNPRVLTILFYCMIRFALINPSFFLANVDIVTFMLSKILELVDLLFVDSFVGITAMQFLLERRVCISLAQAWMRIEKNTSRVMAFLADSLQSSDTLDCVLSALVKDDTGGWDVLMEQVDFPAIFKNLFINSPRSHSKLTFLLSKYGLYAESEPFHIPLGVPPDRRYTVTRWGSTVYDTQGVHCYRVRIQDKFPAEFFLTHEFLEIFCASKSVEELSTAPIIEYVIQYRWDNWGYYATLGLGLLHIFYCLSAMTAIFCICSEEFDECRLHPSHWVSVVIVVFINTLYMSTTALQFRMSDSAHAFFGSVWNITQMLMIGFCHVCILLGTVLGPTPAIRILTALFALLLWAFLPYFGRGSFGMASNIHQLRIIVWEVRYFVLILGLFNCAFAVAFRVLGIFPDFWEAFILCFNMILGDLKFYTVENHLFAELLFLVFVLCVAIILTNSLIAFMEGSLGKAREKEHVAAIISQAQFLYELEIRMLPFNRIAALFNLSSDETLQEYLSPSAMPVRKDDPSGGGKRGAAKGGAQNELVILFPESFGVPNLESVADEYSGASHSSERFRVERQINTTATAIPNELIYYRERLDKVEFQVSVLDTKLDQILAILTAQSKPPVGADFHEATPEGFLATSSSDRAFSTYNPNVDRTVTPPSGVRFGTTPVSSIAPITYSYFGSQDDSADDQNNFL